MKLTEECKQVLPIVEAALQKGNADPEKIFREACMRNIFITRAQVREMVEHCKEGDSEQTDVSQSL